MNWTDIHVEVNDGRSNVKRSEKRLNYLTIGLRVLYDDQNLTIENCKAWRQNYGQLNLLLNSYAKIAGFQRILKLPE